MPTSLINTEASHMQDQDAAFNIGLTFSSSSDEKSGSEIDTEADSDDEDQVNPSNKTSDSDVNAIPLTPKLRQQEVVLNKGSLFHCYYGGHLQQTHPGYAAPSDSRQSPRLKSRSSHSRSPELRNNSPTSNLTSNTSKSIRWDTKLPTADKKAIESRRVFRRSSFQPIDCASTAEESDSELNYSTRRTGVASPIIERAHASPKASPSSYRRFRERRNSTLSIDLSTLQMIEINLTGDSSELREPGLGFQYPQMSSIMTPAIVDTHDIAFSAGGTKCAGPVLRPSKPDIADEDMSPIQMLPSPKSGSAHKASMDYIAGRPFISADSRSPQLKAHSARTRTSSFSHTVPLNIPRSLELKYPQIRQRASRENSPRASPVVRSFDHFPGSPKFQGRICSFDQGSEQSGTNEVISPRPGTPF